MSEAPEEIGRASPDLSALTASERGILALLARGHTIKSVAALEQLSEHAVNERLRSARRKTGLGSSRELARLLDHQESWDHVNRADAEPKPAASTPQTPSWTGVTLKAGVFAMVITLVAALAGLALQAETHVSPKLNDPLVEASIGPPEAEANLHQLHAQVHAEPRDRTWAIHTEASLRRAYLARTELTKVLQPLRVTCGENLCEVAGAMQGGKPRVLPAMAVMQGPELRDAVNGLGLESIAGAFGGRFQGGDSFVVYWKRKPG